MKKALKRTAEKTNSPITGLIAFVVFAGVAIASQHHTPSDFIAQKVSAYDSTKTRTYAQTKAHHRADALKDLYYLTEADIASPVNLFDEKGHAQ